MGASWRRRCTARAAEGKTPTRGHGACMAGAGRSQRQKARRNTISTVVLALIRPPALGVAGGLEFRSVFRRAGLGRLRPRHDGLWPGICAVRCRWHRPASVLGWWGWTKLPAKSTTYSVTLVKQIIGGDAPPASAEVKFLTVGEESAGQRLDNFLIRLLKGVPKTHVYRIIRSGEVRVNKGRAGADTRVEIGDVVRVPPVRVSEKAAEKLEKPAPPREFPIVFEDEHL